MDSLAQQQPPSLQRHQQQPPPPHHHQLPPGRMMPPGSYSTHHHHHLPNNSTAPPPTNNTIITHETLQQRFAFDGSDQYADGSSPPGGFRPGGFNIEPARKKRGRPRKYSPSPDGNIALGLAPAPVPVTTGSAGGHLESANDGGSAGGTPGTDPAAKKHRGRPPGSGKKQMDALGAPGVGFTPHVITVKAGEDIASKMTAFSQQGPRTVCILSANGAISNVTLRQPAMSGGTVTYEGRFEIISLSGSFLLTDSDGNQSSRSSGLSVSLAGSDGRVLGGGVAGSLVAATPVQVVVGSFITDVKKPKSSSSPAVAPPTNMLTFGGGGSVPGASPASDGPSSESSGGDSGSSPLHRHPYSNASQQHQQQQQPPPQMPMYSNMGWPNSTMNMLRN
ncbi:AT-hook motif nuclear-localized protein 10-like [Bidens hawaiensis]|uniref:AT-hook motif nuclear-localized protein 10-like n=1 Tax=Bidens hawaiensis TaxID=980011 RepID=UPI00404A7E0E